ncbi:MAG: ABC transporter ATP-binding protein [Rhizobiales bacterium]|nr:ABC transporter ATP-binding protein [Hyphomicrobiales bacterium]
MAAVNILEVRNLSRHYGGLAAVKDVSLDVAKGEVRAIIGPNGAGKTTLVSMISGRITPSAGHIAFIGRDITRTKSWNRVLLGIVYTFQVTSIYRNLTCYENVALAAQRRRPSVVIYREKAIRTAVLEALGRVGLAGDLNRQAGILPYGHQRLLEVAMALALTPKLLILDEPTQGLAPSEIAAFCDLVRDVSQGATVLLIEHNLKVVLELASQITVMDQGAIIAEGTPKEIEQHPAVRRAYLGQ